MQYDITYGVGDTCDCGVIVHLRAEIHWGWVLSPWEELGCAMGEEDPGDLSQLVPWRLDI